MSSKLAGFLALAVIAGLCAGSVLTFAVMQWTHRISNVASLKVVGVGVFKDVNFTVTVTQIDWGIVEAGENKNFSGYVKNESNVPITLSMYTEEWSPPNASGVISVTWDYGGGVIPTGGFVPVTFTLRVDPAVSTITSFSFTIVIVGSG
jgi:hypothetical protein